MPAKPEFYTLAEFRKLSGSFKKPVVIYFNQKQLANLNGSARPKSGKPPAKSVTLTISEVAGFDGAFITPNCPETFFADSLKLKLSVTKFVPITSLILSALSVK